MNARAKKILLLLLAAALLFGAGQSQKLLNQDRARLGLTVAATLQDAPPVLAFTTVALGGFRGLISNFLWIRANDLQQDDKFFEAAQLADWITDLEPHFEEVWIFQAWNMAFNISVKFKDFGDRWRWVQRGIELLRDDGLRYNPDDVLMYRELAWFFQFKLGANLDDANEYYKVHWAEDMTPFFGPHGTNFVDLIHPQTAEERTNALILREKYKMDPVFAQKVNEEWGPLDWRLPEASAIYWAALGLEKAKEHPDKVNKDDLITLRRVIYQSEQQAFRHGRIISNPFTHGVELAPNLDLIPKANDSYVTMMKEALPGDTNNIAQAHRNFLRDAVYFLYVNDRIAAAAKWFKYLGEEYPNKIILDNDTNSFPRNLTLDQYCVGRVQEDVGETMSQERVTAALQGLLMHAYLDLAIGQDDRCAGYKLLAQKVYALYQKKIAGSEERKPLPAWAALNRSVLNQLLDPQQGLPYAARAVLRTQLGLGPETNSVAPFAISTNTVPLTATNAAENVPTNSAAQ
jgi:hypothetical protein